MLENRVTNTPRVVVAIISSIDEVAPVTLI